MTESKQSSRSLSSGERIRGTVSYLSRTLGPRSYLDRENLEKSSDYIFSSFKSSGYDCSYQSFRAGNFTARNVIAEKTGQIHPHKILVIGAHYDTVEASPGADDNASGVAVLIELSRLLSDVNLDYTIQFVAFTLEEPPFFTTALMGSKIFVKELKKSLSGNDTEIIGMICLESVGYYSKEKNSQQFPLPFLKHFYPDTGNFITVVSNIRSVRFSRKISGPLKKHSRLPVENFIGPSVVTGVDWSDHASFWEAGIPAVMLTDTALFRNPNYHDTSDTLEKLDYAAMEGLAQGLSQVLREEDFQ